MCVYGSAFEVELNHVWQVEYGIQGEHGACIMVWYDGAGVSKVYSLCDCAVVVC